jgi:UDP-glucose 4-epimerase
MKASINRRVKCFIFTSCIAVYGKTQVLMSEEMTPMPARSAGSRRSKVFADIEITKNIPRTWLEEFVMEHGAMGPKDTANRVARS